MRDLITNVSSMGFNITDIDIGGGYGVRYNRKIIQDSISSSKAKALIC